MTEETTTTPRLMTIRQAAKLLGIPESALRGWVKARKVPAIFAGSRAYINVEKLARMLEEM